MDQTISLTRRDLLKTGTGVLTGLVVAGSPLARFAGGPVWAIGLTALTSSEGAALMAMARTICPHDKLEDAAYALVVRAVDEDASKDPSNRKLIQEGVATRAKPFQKADISCADSMICVGCRKCRWRTADPCHRPIMVGEPENASHGS